MVALCFPATTSKVFAAGVRLICPVNLPSPRAAFARAHSPCAEASTGEAALAGRAENQLAQATTHTHTRMHFMLFSSFRPEFRLLPACAFMPVAQARLPPGSSRRSPRTCGVYHAFPG